MKPPQQLVTFTTRAAVDLKELLFVIRQQRLRLWYPTGLIGIHASEKLVLFLRIQYVFAHISKIV